MTFTPNLDRAIAKHKRATSPTPRLDATIERFDSIRADKGIGGWKETDHPRNAHGQFVTKGSAAMRKGLFEYQALQKPGKHGSAQGVVKHMLKSGEYSMEDIQAAAEAGYQSDTNKVKPGYAKWVKQQMIQHHGWDLPPTPEVSHYKGAGAESELPSAEVPPPGETPSESGLKTSMDVPADDEDEPTPLLAGLPEAETPHVAPEPAVAPAPTGPKSKYEAGGAIDQFGADLLQLQLKKAKGNFPDHLKSDLTDFEKAFPDSETTVETKAVAAGKIDQLTEAFETEGVDALKKKIADIDYIEPDETMNPEAIDAINDMIHAAKIHVGVKDKKILFGSQPGPAHPASKYIDSLPHSVNIQLGDLGYELNAMPKPIANAFKSELINLNEALHQFDSGEPKMLENYSLFPGADGPFGEQVKNLNNAILQAKTYVGGHDPYKIAQLKKRMAEDAAKLPPEAAGPILDGLKGFDGLSKEKQDAARKTVLMMKEGIESENPSQYFEHIVFPQAAWDVAGLDEAITAVKAAYPPKSAGLSHGEAHDILAQHHAALGDFHPDVHGHIGNLVNHLPGMNLDHADAIHDKVTSLSAALKSATSPEDLSAKAMDIDPLPEHNPGHKIMENVIHDAVMNPQKIWDYAQNSYAKKNGVQESEPKDQFGPVSSKNSDVDDLYNKLTAPADPQASFDNALVTAHKNFPDEVKKHFAGLAYAPHHLNQPIADHINAIDAALKSPNPGAALAAIQPMENPDDYGSINTANAGLEAAQKLYPDPSKQASTASAPGVPATYAKGFKPLGAMAQVPAITKKVAAHLTGDVAEKTKEALWAFQNSSGVGNYNKPVFKAAISHLINASNAGSPQHMLDALEGIPLPTSTMQYKKKLVMAIDAAKEQAIAKGAVPSAGATVAAAPSTAPSAPAEASMPSPASVAAAISAALSSSNDAPKTNLAEQVAAFPDTFKTKFEGMLPYLPNLTASNKEKVNKVFQEIADAIAPKDGTILTPERIKSNLSKIQPVPGSGMSVSSINNALETAKQHFGASPIPATPATKPVAPLTSAQPIPHPPKGQAKQTEDHSLPIPAAFINQGITPTFQVKTDTSTVAYKKIQERAAKAHVASSINGSHVKKVIPTATTKWWHDHVDAYGREQIRSYTDGGYSQLNDALRQEALGTPIPPAMNTKLNAIHDLFEHEAAELTDDVIVHRGENVPQETIDMWIKNLSNGSKVAYKKDGFTSASIASRAAFWDKNVQFQILAKKGTKMIAPGVPNVSHHQSENEVVFQHGQTFHVYEITKGSNGQTFVKMAVY